MKVLVVDDDDEIRLVVLLTLERLGGFDLMAASTGAEALALAAASSFDLILLDVMMPDVDGPETLVRLRAQPETQKTPVVFLTAKAMPDEVARLERLGRGWLRCNPEEIRKVKKSQQIQSRSRSPLHSRVSLFLLTLSFSVLWELLKCPLGGLV